ncbi:MAG TPA: carboxypeptidase-like regulatory domain-containing protein, partial [Dehalococcoidia bacterium]
MLSVAAHAQSQDATGPGRVAVTIALEGLRIPAVQVELRDVAGKVVVARTTADAIGQVLFSDVAPGRYVVLATREGFADAESAPFDVRNGATEQV